MRLRRAAWVKQTLRNHSGIEFRIRADYVPAGRDFEPHPHAVSLELRRSGKGRWHALRLS